MAAEPPPLTAELRGATVVAGNGALSFALPEEWIRLQQAGVKNVHLPGAALAEVEHGRGEWDTEYAQVVNAIIPFRFAVLHAGGEGWHDDHSFGDLQMRVYLGGFDPAEVHDAAGGLSQRGGENPLFAKVQRLEFRSGPWQGSRMRYPLWYFDYGGTAVVDVYTRREGATAVAFVFMYAEGMQPAEAATPILESVRIGG